MPLPTEPVELDSPESVGYRLSNMKYGPTKLLTGNGALTDNLHMSAPWEWNISNQVWFFVRSRFHARPTYIIQCANWGNMRSVDLLNDRGINSRHVLLSNTGHYSGQYWTVTKWDDGSYRLHNQFTGQNMSLAAKEGLTVDEGDREDQHWCLTKVTNEEVGNLVVTQRWK